MSPEMSTVGKKHIYIYIHACVFGEKKENWEYLKRCIAYTDNKLLYIKISHMHLTIPPPQPQPL